MGDLTAVNLLMAFLGPIMRVKKEKKIVITDSSTSIIWEESDLKSENIIKIFPICHYICKSPQLR